MSTDTHFTHMAWRETSSTIGKIQFPMVGDPTLVLSRNFGVLIEAEGLAEAAIRKLDLSTAPAQLEEWAAIVDRIFPPKRQVTIALVGKYVEPHDAYI